MKAQAAAYSVNLLCCTLLLVASTAAVQQTCCYVVTSGKEQEGDRGLLVVDNEVCVPCAPSSSQVSRDSQLLQPGLMLLECTGNHVQYEG